MFLVEVVFLSFVVFASVFVVSFTLSEESNSLKIYPVFPSTSTFDHVPSVPTTVTAVFLDILFTVLLSLLAFSLKFAFSTLTYFVVFVSVVSSVSVFVVVSSATISSVLLSLSF